ncbi:uncharacterized protein LOC131030361 isoform X2 [Cryptomeria japonica]|nr:uncharacterized protein LOC131030361 isoform X2 [Cryptomeria japonica]
MVDSSCSFVPKCSFCLQILTHSSRSVTRLGCLHVLHNSCLLLLLKGSSSPTGYTCPSCKSQIWPTKKQFVSSGSSLANQLEEIFAKSHIFMLDKNSLLPLASELLSNFSEQGFSQPRSEIRSTVFSLSSPLAEMYKDPKSQKAQQNYIPKDQNVLESGETLNSPRKTINIETQKSCSPEIVIAESAGSPKISMVYSRNCSFRGEKKSTDCPVEDCGKGLMHIPSGAETEHIGSSLPHSSLEKSVLPLTSPTYKMASKSHSTQDATDGRWRRYRRDALIDPRKILLLFATLSSMGTMILIYFTLQSEKLVKVLYA